jgi:hypothetical protein
MAPVQVQSCGFHFIISTKNKQKYPVNESNVHKTTTPQALLRAVPASVSVYRSITSSEQCGRLFAGEDTPPGVLADAQMARYADMLIFIEIFRSGLEC